MYRVLLKSMVMCCHTWDVLCFQVIHAEFCEKASSSSLCLLSKSSAYIMCQP